ncbi:hypothetical protein V4R08_01990 [Nitrobacter sp. NHB1]|uniref:hypothetical protein n=1 Tax=Nitrobacter sp. NHB1 TaxID=3119830 RepID=UPI002FFF8C4E
MTRSNPVFEGLAAGLRPADATDEPGTFHVDLADIRAAERLRLVKHAERQTELMEASLAAQQRLADAAERQAAAFETLSSLLAGCIGIGTSACSGEWSSDPWKMRDAFYLRTGEGRRNFGCDQTGDDSDAA